MRAVVQRVSRARVTVDGRTTGEIGAGLVVLLGVGAGDDEQAARYLADKIAELRIFEDEAGKMNRSFLETGGALLAVSQFTLYGDCRKGRRPSFDRAARPDPARSLYEKFVGFLRQRGVRVEQGVFQAMMEVELVNDGPVTLLLDSERQF
jgi:D-tyrosyl-tRNA(Tyr) deacylase